MKYSIDDSVARIEEKKKRLIYRRKLRNVRILAAMTVATLIAFVTVLWQYTGFSAVDGAYSAYGAFMLPEEAGGYIIVGVLCFAAAVVITLLCIRWRNRNGPPKHEIEKQGKDQKE
ncbi:MAG: hypothetical protein J5824_08110 [Lachnospiraceae bacterium]|nr:hypothetical protein [Lachnospiraceae bacterium]